MLPPPHNVVGAVAPRRPEPAVLEESVNARLDGVRIAGGFRAVLRQGARAKKTWQVGTLALGQAHVDGNLVPTAVGDLPSNHWNVDDLYILTDTADQAREFERIAQDEDWQADNVTLLENEQERSHALGTSRPGYIISFWWD